MTPEPINLTQLRKRVQARVFEQSDHPRPESFAGKAYANPTVQLRATELLALIDTAEAAQALVAHLIDGGPDVGYAEIADDHDVNRLRESLARYTTE